MKKIFIKRQLKTITSNSKINAYPKKISNVGIILSDHRILDYNLISILKNGLGNDCKVYKIFLGKSNNEKDAFRLDKTSFSFLGKLKDDIVFETLKNLDMLIDVSFKSSNIKDFALLNSNKAYKITLGSNLNEHFNLSINLESNQMDLFAEEIIKYHKILSHEQGNI